MAAVAAVDTDQTLQRCGLFHQGNDPEDAEVHGWAEVDCSPPCSSHTAISDQSLLNEKNIHLCTEHQY